MNDFRLQQFCIRSNFSQMTWNELDNRVLLIPIFQLPFLVQFYERVFLNIFDKFLDCKPPGRAQLIVIFGQFQLDTHYNLVWEAKFLSKTYLKKDSNHWVEVPRNTQSAKMYET